MLKGEIRIEIFHKRFPWIGPLFWIMGLQHFIVIHIVAAAWPTPYRYAHNTISDLGNTACGIFQTRTVCSPLHYFMNASYIILGLTMLLAILIYFEFQKNKGSLIGFLFMELAGFGTMFIGVFPMNQFGLMHILGSSIALIAGTIAMIILGLSLKISNTFKIYSLVSACVSIVGTVLYVSKEYLGLGQGFMELVAADPQAIWFIVFGLYMTHNHFRYVRPGAKRSRSKEPRREVSMTLSIK